jgi:hypothetical protein
MRLYPSALNSAYETEAENKVPGITLITVVGTPEKAKELGAVFINPRTDSGQLTEGVDPNEEAQRRPGSEPEL